MSATILVKLKTLHSVFCFTNLKWLIENHLEEMLFIWMHSLEIIHSKQNKKIQQRKQKFYFYSLNCWNGNALKSIAITIDDIVYKN